MHRSPIVIAQSLPAAASFDLDVDSIVVLPSSLAAGDQLAVGIAGVLARSAPGRVEVLMPPTLHGRLRSLFKPESAAWRTVDLGAIDPSCELGTVAISRELADAGGVVIACDLDRVASRGPYVLDVAASYASPATRMRLHAERGRVALAAELVLGFSLKGAILALTVEGEHWYIATPDPIAGELAALALAEGSITPDRAVVGPWEDPIVQRATELELGAPLPADLEIAFAPGTPASRISEAIARQLARRLGIA